jgi:hypothetical protein
MSNGTEEAGVDGPAAAAGELLGPPDEPNESDALVIETSSDGLSLDPDDDSGAARAAAETTRLPNAVV